MRLLFALLLCLPGLAWATPARLTNDTERLDLLPHLSVLEDPGKSLQLDDLLGSDGARRFAPLGDRTASFGYSPSAWWLRASVTNDADQPRDEQGEREVDEHDASCAAHHPKDDTGRLRAGGREPDQRRDLGSKLR